jgi:hypothetical protein
MKWNCPVEVSQMQVEPETFQLVAQVKQILEIF